MPDESLAYADLNTDQKGVPLPILAGEGKLSGIPMCLPQRMYDQVAEDEGSKK